MIDYQALAAYILRYSPKLGGVFWSMHPKKNHPTQDKIDLYALATVELIF